MRLLRTGADYSNSKPSVNYTRVYALGGMSEVSAFR